MTRTGTALGSDFDPPAPESGTFSWADGDAAVKQLTWNLKGNTAVGSDKTVGMRILNPVGCTLGISGVTITVVENDQASSSAEYPAPTAGTVSVSTRQQLVDAIAAAPKGRHIILEDEFYTGDDLTIQKTATAEEPIVIRARNRLKAEIRFNVWLRGSDIYLHGIKFNRNDTDGGSGVGMGARTDSERSNASASNPYATRMVVRRCEIFRLRGTLVSPLGTHHRIEFCDLSIYGRQEVPTGPGGNFRGVHDAGQFSQDITVRRNHFHDAPIKHPTDYHLYKISGVSTGNNPREWREIGRWLIKDNLFRNCGLFDCVIKTSRNKVIGNTIDGSGPGSNNRMYFNQRAGDDNWYLSNYMVSNSHDSAISVHGARNIIGYNVFEDPIYLKHGDYDYDQLPPQGETGVEHQAYRTILFRNGSPDVRTEIRDGFRYNNDTSKNRLATQAQVVPWEHQRYVPGSPAGANPNLDAAMPSGFGDFKMAVRLGTRDVGPGAPWVAD